MNFVTNLNDEMTPTSANSSQSNESDHSGGEEDERIMPEDVVELVEMIEPLHVNMEEIEQPRDAFITLPVPIGQGVQCRVIRSRNFKGSTIYNLYLEESPAVKTFLMHARKRHAPSLFFISTDRASHKPNDSTVLGIVRSKYAGTEYILYDSSQRQCVGVRYILDHDIHKAPRRLVISMPTLQNGQLVPSSEKESLVNRLKSGNDRELIVMKNKRARWNQETGMYNLNFNGRVSHSSVKNFQITHPQDLDYIVLQFGRVGHDSFTLDVQYPLSIFQAFGIAMTSFEPKFGLD